jgi:hypothetical protein
MLDDTMLHRIQVDIAVNGVQSCVRLDQESFVPALKQMSFSASPCVDPLSVAEGDIVDDLGQWYLRDLDCQVRVVGYEAIDVNIVAVSVDTLP